MFLYTALEELRVLREFATCNWRNHPKFNQNIVRHLFKTCLPHAVYENKKEGLSMLKIIALTATGKALQKRAHDVYAQAACATQCSLQQRQALTAQLQVLRAALTQSP